MTNHAEARTNMVESQIRPSSVTDPRLIEALRRVPRETFVAKSRQSLAYIDEDVAIGAAEPGAPGRFLMEPRAFAKLVQLAHIRPGDLVLDIGCATGYSAAVLARLADAVVALESDEKLAAAANQTLSDLGADNAAVITGPLADGCAKQGPYDVVFLDGAVDYLPEALFDQLKDGGRLVAIEGTGPAGKARLYVRERGTVSGRTAFDATVQPLPGFERKAVFSF